MNAVLSDGQLEDLDQELAAAGVPLLYRALNCFKKSYGSVPDGQQRQKLFDPINEWYLRKYGDAVRWDGVIARIPILIRDVVYLGQARFVSEVTPASVQDAIQDLPEEIARSLSNEEVRLVAEKLILGSNSFYSLYNLLVDDDWLEKTERELTRRAKCDLENATATLKHTGDTQSAIVQTHEAAEKYLKAALSRAGSTKKLKSFRHDIPKLFDELLQIEKRYSCLSLPVANLQRLSPNMELRYSSVPRSLEMAIEAYYGALYVCGMIAQMWLFDRARGSSVSKFNECSFYIDGANATFYCKRIRGDEVTLTLFQSSNFAGSQMADIILNASQSASYLEVRNAEEDARLRARYAAHLRNPGRKVSPKEIELKMTHGPEGSYTTAILKVPISKPISQQSAEKLEEVD